MTDPWIAERVVEDSNGCWIWQLSTNKGYGRAKFEGRHQYAHRIAWELTNGPIPDGLVVDHMCFVRACLNPAHLRLLTVSENAAGKPPGFAERKRRTHCKRGHDLAVEARHKPDGRRECGVCHRERNRSYRKAAA